MVPEGRGGNAKHANSMVEVGAKLLARYRSFEVAICRCNYSNVAAVLVNSTEWPEGAEFDRAQ